MSEKKGSYVIKFGLQAPMVRAEEVEDQIKIGHEYRNALVAVEHNHQKLIKDAEHDFGIDVLKVAVAKVREAEKEAKGKEKKRLSAQAKQINEKIGDIRATLAFRTRMHEIDGRDIEPKKKEEGKKVSAAEARNAKRGIPNDSIDARARRAVRTKFAKEKKLFWGTYLVVERAMQASKTSSRKKDGPKFVRWDGGGHVGIQIQTGDGKVPLRGCDVFAGTDERCSITSRPSSWARPKIKPGSLTSIHEKKYARESLAMSIRRHALNSDDCKHGEKRQAGRVRLCLKIGTEMVDEVKTTKSGKQKVVKKKRNIIAEWPMRMHRDIPDDANITWVSVTRRRVGSKHVWSCEFTISGSAPIETTQRRGVAAIVFGWRKRNRLVRVAEWLSTTGEDGCLELLDLPLKKDRSLSPASKNLRRSNLNKTDIDDGRGGIIDGIRVVNGLKAVRDNHFNEAREQLATWMESQRSIPAWMAKRTTKDDRVPTKKQAVSYLRQWKESSKNRLAALVNEWKKNRFDGDDDIFVTMEKWRYKDFHLWNWERRQDLSSRRRRTNAYRNFAAQFTDAFGMLLVDGTDFKKLKEKEDKENDLPGRKPASMSQMAAPGELREIIRQAALRRGRVYEKRPQAGLAQLCPKCKTKHKAHKDSDSGVFACTHCTFEATIMRTRLLNTLAKAGHESDVQRIIEEMEKGKDRMMQMLDPDTTQPEA